jgi:hypothetical protein
MSHYATLDQLLIDRISHNKGLSLMQVSGAEVRQEAERLAQALGRERFRVIDGRLQTLRAAGQIAHVRGKGWVAA